MAPEAEDGHPAEAQVAHQEVARDQVEGAEFHGEPLDAEQGREFFFSIGPASDGGEEEQEAVEAAGDHQETQKRESIWSRVASLACTRATPRPSSVTLEDGEGQHDARQAEVCGRDHLQDQEEGDDIDALADEVARASTRKELATRAKPRLGPRSSGLLS